MNGLYTFIFIVILVPCLMIVFRFFDIGMETYGIYLLWIVTLICLTFFFSGEPDNIFKE